MNSRFISNLKIELAKLGVKSSNINTLINNFANDSNYDIKSITNVNINENTQNFNADDKEKKIKKNLFVRKNTMSTSYEKDSLNSKYLKLFNKDNTHDNENEKNTFVKSSKKEYNFGNLQLKSQQVIKLSSYKNFKLNKINSIY